MTWRKMQLVGYGLKIATFVEMKRITLIPCLFLFLLACQNEVKKTEEESATQDTPYLDPDFEYVQLIPDSLKTDDQKELVRKLQTLIAENLKSVDNELVFTLTREEFVAKGIPEEYYILIQKDVVNNNRFLKENNIQNVDSLLEHSGFK